MADPKWLQRACRKAAVGTGNKLNEWWAKALVRAGYKYVFIEVPVQGWLPRHGGGRRRTPRVPHVDIVFGNSLDDLHWLDSKRSAKTGFTRAQRITYPAVNERGGDIVLRDNDALKRRYWATCILNFADGRGYDLHQTKLKPQRGHVVFHADQAAIEMGSTSVGELLADRRGDLHPAEPDYPNLDKHGLPEQRMTSRRGDLLSAGDGAGSDASGGPRRGGGFAPAGGSGTAAVTGKLAKAGRGFASASRLLGKFVVKRLLPVADILDGIQFVLLLLEGKYKEALHSIPIVGYAFLPADVWTAIDTARRTKALDKAIHDQLPKILARQLRRIVEKESERFASYYFSKAWRGDYPQPLYLYLSPTLDFVNRKGGQIAEYEFAPTLRPRAINWLVRVGRRASSEEVQSVEIVADRPDLVRLRVTYERPFLAPADLLWSYLHVLGDNVVNAWDPAQRPAWVNEQYARVMRDIARVIAALKNDARHGLPKRNGMKAEDVAGFSRATLYRALAKTLESTHATVVTLVRSGQLDEDRLSPGQTLGGSPSGAGAFPELGVSEGLRKTYRALKSLGQDQNQLRYLRFEHDSFRANLPVEVDSLLEWDPYQGWEGELRELLEPLGRQTVDRWVPATGTELRIRPETLLVAP